MAEIQDTKLLFASFGELFKGSSEEEARHVTSGKTIAELRQTRQLEVSQQWSKRRNRLQLERTVGDFTLELKAATMNDMKTIRDSTKAPHKFNLPSFSMSNTSYARAFFPTYQEFGMKQSQAQFNKTLHQNMVNFYRSFGMHLDEE